jgi:peroxiredoxin
MMFTPGNFPTKTLALLLLAFCLTICSPPSGRADATNAVVVSAADLAWQALQHAQATPPEPLKQLPDRMYSEEEILAYYNLVATRAGEVADLARKFYTQYPDHSQAAAAKKIYLEMLYTSVESNTTNRIAELETVTRELQQAPELAEAARFQLSLHLLHSAVSGREHQNNEVMRVELEQRARQLAKDYPNHPDGVNFLLNMARTAAPEKSAALAREIPTLTADAKIKTECQGLLNRIAALGQPLKLKLPLADGQVLDLEQMRGKVVCLFFWDAAGKFSAKAIWAVNGLYKTYHTQGVEIWGVNFDANPAAAATLLKDNQVEWPQYYDLPAGGKIQEQFGYAQPMVWLVDKKGVLRELKAERGPEPMIKKLLAEE